MKKTSMTVGHGWNEDFYEAKSVDEELKKILDILIRWIIFTNDHSLSAELWLLRAESNDMVDKIRGML